MGDISNEFSKIDNKLMTTNHSWHENRDFVFIKLFCQLQCKIKPLFSQLRPEIPREGVNELMKS